MGRHQVQEPHLGRGQRPAPALGCGGVGGQPGVPEPAAEQIRLGDPAAWRPAAAGARAPRDLVEQDQRSRDRPVREGVVDGVDRRWRGQRAGSVEHLGRAPLEPLSASTSAPDGEHQTPRSGSPRARDGRRPATPSPTPPARRLDRAPRHRGSRGGAGSSPACWDRCAPTRSPCSSSSRARAVSPSASRLMASASSASASQGRRREISRARPSSVSIRSRSPSGAVACRSRPGVEQAARLGRLRPRRVRASRGRAQRRTPTPSPSVTSTTPRGEAQLRRGAICSSVKLAEPAPHRRHPAAGAVDRTRCRSARCERDVAAGDRVLDRTLGISLARCTSRPHARCSPRCLGPEPPQFPCRVSASRAWRRYSRSWLSSGTSSRLRAASATSSAAEPCRRARRRRTRR